jgi:DUF4097 and DUF4098 domain-containing protein YvlB
MTGIFAVTLILAQFCNPVVASTLPNTIVCFVKNTEEFREIYEVKSGTELHIENANGDVKISKWRKPNVEVRAIKKTTHEKDELAKVHIEVTIGDAMEIRTKYLEKDVRVSIDYVIQIPEQMVVKEVETSNGDIGLIDTKGDSKVRTSNGDVNLRDVDGSVQVHTANGDVTAIDVSGMMQVETANGDVIIKGVATIIEATTSSGDISAAIKHIPDQGTSITTSNGSIDLYIDDKLNADISLATTLGKIMIQDLELRAKISTKTESSTVVNGIMGQGGNSLNARTSVGNINLHRLGR